MQRGKMLASLATEAWAKQNDKPASRLKSNLVKKRSKSVRTYPNYVDMFDVGKWNELDEYIKYNKNITGLDICTKVFCKKESVPLIFEGCNVCEGEGEAGEIVVNKTVVHDVFESKIVESEVCESVLGVVHKESQICKNLTVEVSISDKGKTIIDKTPEKVCESEVPRTVLCEIRGAEVDETYATALHEVENDTMFTKESIVFSIDPTNGELVPISSQQERNTRRQLFPTESLSFDKGTRQGSSEGFEHMYVEEIPAQERNTRRQLVPTESLSFDKGTRQGSSEGFEHMSVVEIPANVKQCQNEGLSDSSKKMKKYVRRWDRKNFCLYCRSLVTNFSRHIIKFHTMEKEVIEYQSVLDEDLNIRKIKRQEITDALRKRGNFLYNSSTSNHSEILPTRRSSKNVQQPKTLYDYLTCQHCLGMFSRKNFYQHRNKCTSSETPEEFNESINIGEVVFGSKERKGTKSDGIQIVPNVGGASDLLVSRILPILSKDEFGLIASNDPLILSIGSHFLFSHQDKKDEYSITQKLRDSAKLLKLCRKDPSIINFEDIFKPSKFEVVISCVQQLCGLDSQSGSVKVVGMPARLAYVIQEGAKLLSCEVITNNNISPQMKEKVQKDINEFIVLYKNKWKFMVSSNAEKTRKKLRSIKPTILPDDDDIKTISAKIKKLEIDYYKDLSKHVTPEKYEDLCKITIAHIITFNRRRSGEAARAELQYYINRPSQEDLTEDVLATLSEEEREALPRLTVFMIPGKLLHSVPILLTAEMKANVDLIISSRVALGIPRENNLLFARTSTLNPFDGSKILRDLRETCNLKKKSFMTATGLRHHLATKSQVNGSEQFTENVCQFLGHTKGVHKQNYRIPLQAIQRGQIGCRLLCMEEESKKRNYKDTHYLSQTISKNFKEACSNLHGQGQDENQTYEETCNKSDNSQDEDFIPSDSEVTSRKKVKRKIIARRRWSDEEKQCVLKALGQYISNNKNPGMQVCTELVRSNPILAGRTCQQVNALINNYNTGKAKLPTSFQSLLS